ncbi:unnamed protein product [Withania somnifera]
MDTDERLTALKRAYADIILNMAKEAAARIMSSQQKAVRYKQELKVAKVEAVGMLLHLKQMMDSKINEAELTSLSQQTKIEELEAQLQEAEDIVNDLRVELREAQDELEKVTSCKEKGVRNSEEVDTAPPEELHEENRVVLIPKSQESQRISNTEVMDMKQKNPGYQPSSKMVQIGKPNIAGPDLPSIILRSKVPELYRNGCTQRIRACEGKLLDGDLSVSKGVENTNNEIGDGVEVGEGICSAPFNKVDDVVNSQENIQQTDNLLSSWHLLKSVRQKRRRAMRNWKADYPSPGSSPDHFLNIGKTSNTGSLTAHSGNANNCAPDEDPSNIGHGSSIVKVKPDMKLESTETHGNELQIVESFRRKRRAMRNRKADYPSPRSSPDHFLNIVKTSKTGGLTAHSSPAIDCAPGEDPSQMDHSLLVEKAEPDIKLQFTQMYGNEPQSTETYGVLKSTTGDESVMAKTDLPRQESRSLESLEVLVDRTDFENVTSQSSNSLTKIADVYGEVPSQTVNDRVIKYTFQRKRKREQLSVAEENASIEKSSSKELNGEKLDGPVEPRMSDSATEPSQDSRRMAQVARQLISLSEKKWWQ